MIYLYYTDMFMGYSFGPEHPLQPARIMLTYRMIEEYGFFLGYDTEVQEPYYASENDLLMVHDPGYIQAVKDERPDPALGLDEPDTPIFPGIYDASALIAGASIEAAKRVASEPCVAFNLAGGLHHAFPARASGFCVFNDCALGIRALRKRFKRVLYIDIDAHHGDGVQYIFYEDPSVLTISIHESGKYLFPGTGFVDEIGSGEGYGYSANIPMPMNAEDECYRYAFESVIPALFRWFRPDAVVAQLGVDTHYADPLASLDLTLEGYGYLVRRIKELTDEYANGRMLALGGGGYNLEVVPLAWTLAFQTLRGQEMPEELPKWWVDAIMKMIGRPPLSLPDRPKTKRDVPRELIETVANLKRRLTMIHGDIF